MVRAPKFPFVEGGFAEFDVESRFAKIQNSHLRGGGGGGVLWNLMLSSDLLKSKIPICGRGEKGWGGGWWNQFPTFDAESKFAKKKKKNFAKNFLSFRAKIGTVLFWILNTEWFAIRSIANHKEFCMKLCSSAGFGVVTADQLKLPAVMTLKSCSRCTAWTVCARNEKRPHFIYL